MEFPGIGEERLVVVIDDFLEFRRIGATRSHGRIKESKSPRDIAGLFRLQCTVVEFPLGFLVCKRKARKEKQQATNNLTTPHNHQ